MTHYFSFLTGNKKNSSTNEIGSEESDSNLHEEELNMDQLREEIDGLRAQLTVLQQQNGNHSAFGDQDGQPGQSAPSTSNVLQVTEMVKMQAFYENDPELWFTIIESQFSARKITSEKTKYLQVVGNLNCTTAALIKDIIKAPFTDGHYDKVKSALIAIYAESSTEKFQKLISKTEIGDMKPSQFLHHMKSFADSTVSEAFVKQLWIQRLPVTSRAVLSASNDDLDNLAKMADKMWEVSDRFCISSVGAEKVQEKTNIEKITMLLEKLANKVEALERKEHISRRDVTPQRNRSRSNGKGKSEHELCWFHYKYGNDAKKCREPCKYTDKSKN